MVIYKNAYWLKSLDTTGMINQGLINVINVFKPVNERTCSLNLVPGFIVPCPLSPWKNIARQAHAKLQP